MKYSVRIALLFTALVASLFALRSQQPKTTASIVANSMDAVVLIKCRVPAVVIGTTTVVDTYIVSTAGFVATKYGHILTVAHGLTMCRDSFESNLTVTFFGDSKKHPAKILRYNRYHDVAVLQVPSAMARQPLQLATSDPIPGSRSLTIGHPESIYWSVSEGVANFSRTWYYDPPRKVVQYVGPVNHGNSGGPIFNDQGEVIGAMSFTDPEGVFLGFGVPYDVLESMLRGTH